MYTLVLLSNIFHLEPGLGAGFILSCRYPWRANPGSIWLLIGLDHGEG